MSGTTLYGTTRGYGAFGEGTVFSASLDGSSFIAIHNFSSTKNMINLDGATPQCGLTMGNNNTLFGSANSGGKFGSGVLFRLQVAGRNLMLGKNFANLHSFTALDSSGFNQDGYEPGIEMIAAGDGLYGVVPYGGTHGVGTIFKMNEDGSAFTVLHEFSALDPAGSTNTDGAIPFGLLVLTNGVLYGTSYQGGASGMWVHF